MTTTAEPIPIPTETTAKPAEESGNGEIVDIEQSSKNLLRQMAGMDAKYRTFTPQPRPDMSEYVYRKTARSRKMVADQDRMLYNLQTIHSGLDRLDREVEQLQEETRRRRNQRRYRVPHDGASFVQYYPNKYSLMDFDSTDKYLSKY